MLSQSKEFCLLHFLGRRRRETESGDRDGVLVWVCALPSRPPRKLIQTSID
jgi:hypothetical protein